MTPPSLERSKPTEPAEEIPLLPSDILLSIIVAFLAPMFLGAGGGNLTFARMAAVETVNAYRLRNQADLISVAQIIAFGLAALGSLSLSMLDDLSLTMTLRLRGNANACNRSAEQNRRALAAAAYAAEANMAFVADPEDAAREAAAIASVAAVQQQVAEIQSRQPDPVAAPVAPPPIAITPVAVTPVAPPSIAIPPVAVTPVAVMPVAVMPVAVTPVAVTPIAAPPTAVTPVAVTPPAAPPLTVTPAPATPLTAPQSLIASMSEQQRHALWAAAMTRVAAKFTADLPNLPPAQRREATFRAAALSSCAQDLLSGAPLPPPLRPGDLAAMMRPARR